MRAVDIPIADIWTHSFRKVIATIMSAFQWVSSMALIHGWSLGKVQFRVFFEDDGAYQFCGRTATCIDIGDEDFALLPPHFADGDEFITIDKWEEILPGYHFMTQRSDCFLLYYS